MFLKGAVRGKMFLDCFQLGLEKAWWLTFWNQELTGHKLVIMWNVTLEFVWTTGFPSFLSRRCVCTWTKLWLSTSYFCRTLLRLRYENATPNFCWVSCPINKRGFWDYICVDTHLPRFEALFSFLPPFDALTHIVISVSSAFIFQTFAEVCYSVFVKHSSFKSLLNLRKAYIFQQFADGLLSICVCWIVQRVHLSKVLAAVVLQSKSTEIRSLEAPFHHNLWYFRHRTNEHFRSVLFARSEKTYKQPTVASPLKSLTSTYSTKLLHLLNEPYDITSLQDLMILSF